MGCTDHPLKLMRVVLWHGPDHKNSTTRAWFFFAGVGAPRSSWQWWKADGPDLSHGRVPANWSLFSLFVCVWFLGITWLDSESEPYCRQEKTWISGDCQVIPCCDSATHVQSQRLLFGLCSHFVHFWFRRYCVGVSRLQNSVKHQSIQSAVLQYVDTTRTCCIFLFASYLRSGIPRNDVTNALKPPGNRRPPPCVDSGDERTAGKGWLDGGDDHGHWDLTHRPSHDDGVSSSSRGIPGIPAGTGQGKILSGAIFDREQLLINPWILGYPIVRQSQLVPTVR